MGVHCGGNVRDDARDAFAGAAEKTESGNRLPSREPAAVGFRACRLFRGARTACARIPPESFMEYIRRISFALRLLFDRRACLADSDRAPGADGELVCNSSARRVSAGEDACPAARVCAGAAA